jgi:hypothetical protein
VVGWATADRLRTELVAEALSSACRPPVRLRYELDEQVLSAIFDWRTWRSAAGSVWSDVFAGPAADLTPWVMMRAVMTWATHHPGSSRRLVRSDLLVGK